MKLTVTPDGTRKKVYFLEVSQVEAYKLIESLVAQLIAHSLNTDRAVFFTDKGDYFSIAVRPDQRVKHPTPEEEALDAAVRASVLGLEPEECLPRRGRKRATRGR